MKNFIKKLMTYVGYIFKGKKMEKQIYNLEQKISDLEGLLTIAQKDNSALKDELGKKEVIEKQLSDWKYFNKEVIPEVFTDKFVNKKAAYDTFLKVFERKHFKQEREPNQEQFTSKPKISAVK